MKKILIPIIFAILYTGAAAQDLETIALMDAGSDTQYELSSLKSRKASVLIFFGNRCAYNDYYVGRIKKLVEDFSPQNIEFVLVNSNSSKVIIEESRENMKAYLAKHQLTLPYLIDTNKQLKNTLGAIRSPEVFLITKRNGRLTVVYSGAIDDSPAAEGDVNHAHLRQAILSLLQNENPRLKQTRPVGCLIR